MCQAVLHHPSPKVNLELHTHLTVHSEQCVSIPQGEMVLREQALLFSWDMQNFLFWLMGTFVSFTSDSEGLSARRPMLQQLVLSIEWATLSQARFTTFTLVNMRPVRREAHFSLLPHRFTSVSKAQLHQSDMDSVLLN